MKLLQINTTVNSGSTGRIAEEIGGFVMNQGWASYIAYGRGDRPSKSQTIKIGNKFDQAFHLLGTRLFDKHGFYSTSATKELIRKIDNIEPDIVHLHNLHGYYLNLAVFFEYLGAKKYQVVWTFHDCWPFTGHCTYFDAVNCEKWKTQCFDCPNKRAYPSTYFDSSRQNFINKKFILSSAVKLNIITPSRWLLHHVEESFLKAHGGRVINNGVNLKIFKPLTNFHRKPDEFIILGVASLWDKRKGLDDFIKLRELLPANYRITLIGLSKRQIDTLPPGIQGIERTESIAELISYYNFAEVFVNPTYVDNFPTTNIEALACGTSVITYNTGGSPEAIDEHTGLIYEKGDIEGIAEGVKKICGDGKESYSRSCRKRAEDFYDKNQRYADYLKLYESLLN